MIKHPLKVLSLFDGISCGRIALERAGIEVDTYYASEIEPNAIKIAVSNYSDTIEIGDITKISYDSQNGVLKSENGDFVVGKIDLIIGGSPCIDFSSIGYAKGMTVNQTPVDTFSQYLKLKVQGAVFDGQSYLFWEYIRVLKEINPTYFLLENVVMANRWQNVISNVLGVNPIKINSCLLSAQHRPRLYWTNIPNISMPLDKNIVIDDIFDTNASFDDVSHCLTVQRSFPKLMQKYGYIPERFNAYNASQITNKACALSRGSMITSSCATLLFVKTENGVHTVKDGVLDSVYKTKLKDGHYNIRRLSLIEMERLQTLPDNYTNVKGVSSQKRSMTIGNGWTVDIISHILKNIN